jgi:hypothetical protein
MTDQLLSQGLIAYVGTPGRSDGKSPEDRVVEVAGDAAPDLLPRVEVIMNELHTAKPPLWQDSSLAEVERRAEAWLKAHLPSFPMGQSPRVP